MKNETEALMIQDFPRKKLEDACYRPLGLIERNCEYLLQHLKTVQADQETQQAVQDIAAASARLERALTENFSLVELLQNQKALPLMRVDLCVLMRQVENQADTIREQLGVELVLDKGGQEQCIVQANGLAVETLWLHLLSNALRACQPGGTVRMELSRQQDHYRLLVQDDGCGLPDSEERLLQNRRAFLGGGGAGLLLCREYCRLMSWQLYVGPAPERGTMALVTIPLEKKHPAGKTQLHTPNDLKKMQRKYRLRALLVREMRTMPERIAPEEE